MMNAMTAIYTTRDEAIDEAIIPALDDANVYDLDAIADEVLTTTGDGITSFGYTLNEDVDFWESVFYHML